MTVALAAAATTKGLCEGGSSILSPCDFSLKTYAKPYANSNDFDFDGLQQRPANSSNSSSGNNNSAGSDASGNAASFHEHKLSEMHNITA